MARPTRITVNSGDNSWEAQLNTNLQQLYDRPLPLFVHAGDLTSLESARPAAQFDQCLAWVDYDGAGTPGTMMAFSNGTAWRLISDWEANRRVFRSTGASGNILVTDDVVISTGGSNIILTLPAITDANEGRIVRAKRQGAGGFTLDTTGGDTIDGAATFALGNVDDSFEFISDGTSEWLIFSGSGAGGSAFLGLNDTPGSYSGQTLELVRVNAGETDLEFVPHLFGNIGDTPASFSGQSLLLVRVNSAENALEYAAPAGGIAGNTIFAVAVGTETEILTTGNSKVTFRMPGTFSLDAVRCSLTTGSATGTVTVDINVTGSTILSTKLTIDDSETTSKTAAAPPVLTSDPVAIGDDAEITIDIDDAGSSGDAAGLKVYFEGQANPADFLDLGDAPSSYSGKSLEVVRVNVGETAVEFSPGLLLDELVVLPASGTTGITTTVHADATADWGQRIQSLHATYTGQHLIIRAIRTANSGYNFVHTVSDSGGTPDSEHLLRGDGALLSDVAASTPADYAEMFECVSPSGYPMGRAVQLASGLLDSTKVELASDVDEIIGFTSAHPGVIADTAWNRWHGKYIRTEFGAYAKDQDDKRILNPAFDPDEEYIPREDRDEWMAIGMMGKIWVEGDRANILPGSRVTLISDGVMRPLTDDEKTEGRRFWRVMEVGTWNPAGSYLPIRILFN